MPQYSASAIDAGSAADLPDALDGHLDGLDPKADNDRRASFAAVAVKAFASTTGTLTSEDPETPIGDLLADLRHLCDALDLDFDSLIDRSAMHYNAEIDGQP